MSRRRIRAQAEWKVLTHRPPAGISACTRPRISLAALFVKVIAITPEGSTRPVATNQAKRRVITRVLPEPAPARINSGPSGACTAAA